MKRTRRTKLEINENIYNAATQIIEKSGFAGLTVVGICQIAKIEPVVFYNRYENLTVFISEYVKTQDYWFSEVFEKCKSIKDDKEQYKAIMKTLFFSLWPNKIMQELLRWEIAGCNETTQRTSRLREFHTGPLTERFKSLFAKCNIQIDSVSAILIGGIYYLVLHKELSPFCGIDINTESGKEKIASAIDFYVEAFF